MNRFYNKVLSHTAVIPGASTRGCTTYAVGRVALLSTAGIDTTPILAAMGISGATIGFSAKDIGANAVAAMTLAAKRPFEHGTKWTAGNLYSGTIDHWDLQCEKDDLVLIPNSVAFTSVLTVKEVRARIVAGDTAGNQVEPQGQGRPSGCGSGGSNPNPVTTVLKGCVFLIMAIAGFWTFSFACCVFVIVFHRFGHAFMILLFESVSLVVDKINAKLDRVGEALYQTTTYVRKWVQS